MFSRFSFYLIYTFPLANTLSHCTLLLAAAFFCFHGLISA